MNIYDCAIIGGGPAGVTAAVYLHRANKSVILFEKNVIGGKIISSPKVENIPGFNSISGMEYGEHLSNQLEYNEIEVVYDEVIKINKTEDGLYEIQCMYEEPDYATTIILATGSTNRLLGLDNEKELIGKGISFCSVCDGAFFKNKVVAVVGGGNSALQEAVELSEVASHVYVLQDLEYLTGEEKLQEILKNKENVEIFMNTKVTAINGDKQLKNIVVNDSLQINIDGLFIAIGLIPATDYFKDIINVDERGYGLDTENIFIAGDCAKMTNMKQVIVAEANGAEAAHKVCEYFKKNK